MMKRKAKTKAKDGQAKSDSAGSVDSTDSVNLADSTDSAAAATSITRALSIAQPLAGLVVKGIKPIENRSWKTNYRGMIAIHASGKFLPCVVRDLEKRGVPLSVSSPTDAKENWPTQAILGVVEIADCVYFAGPEDEQTVIDAAKKAGILPSRPTKKQVNAVLFWLNVDCFAWLLKSPIAFKQPIPAGGKLNLWYLSDEQREAAARAIGQVVAATTTGE